MTVTKTDSLYRKEYFGRLQELKDHAPEVFQSFIKFDSQAVAEGRLSVKQKELIAVAVAHTTGCPYCIELHVGNAKKNNATKEEIAESIFVATALKAGSAAAHGVNALNAYDDSGDEEYYKASYFARLKEFADLNGETFKAFADFDQKALKAENLSVKDKELIAVACAHTNGCAYCIDIHTKNAKKAGADLEEISEAIFVAVALKAGSALAHSVNALNAYDEE